VWEFYDKNVRPPLLFILTILLISLALTLRAPLMWDKQEAFLITAFIASGYWAATIYALVAYGMGARFISY